jgi:hypothetical protein
MPCLWSLDHDQTRGYAIRGRLDPIAPSTGGRSGIMATHGRMELA